MQLYSSPLKRALETCQIATMAAPDEIRMDEAGFQIMRHILWAINRVNSVHFQMQLKK